MRKEKIKELIAKGESNGDYDVVVGGAKRPLRQMTIGEVLEYQKGMVGRLGKRSSAVGKYQIIEDTMESLLYVPGSKKLRNPTDFNPDQKFDERAQEWAADTLLERRGFSKWAAGDKSDDEFILSLSQEWASIPDPTKDNEATSHYSGDGLHDRATPHTVTDVREVLTAPQAPEEAPQAQEAPMPPGYASDMAPLPPSRPNPAPMNGMLDTGAPRSPAQVAPLGAENGMLMTPRGDVVNPIEPKVMPETFTF